MSQELKRLLLDPTCMMQQEKISSSLTFKKCRVIQNQGIELYFDCENIQMTKLIQLGMPLVDCIQKLGNPNKEYHKAVAGQLYLNYFELGLDVVVETHDHTVTKLVLYANNLHMPDFCFHDRCFFELNLTKNIKENNLAISKI